MEEYLKSLFSLSGKVAIVTGASGTVPQAIARALARAGANVVLWSRGIRTPIEETVRRFERDSGTTGRTFGVRVEAGNEASVDEALGKTIDRFGIPDILVNGVGGNSEREPFIKLDVASFRKGLELNLVAGFIIPSKAFAACLIEAEKSGSIINIAALSSFRPVSGLWAYDAAKAGILNLTQVTARELAPHGIRVNAIAPGFIIGDQNKALLLNQKTGELTDLGRGLMLRTPAGRFGTPDELEGTAVFLASDHASAYLTGVTIPVDGGFLTDNV